MAGTLGMRTATRRAPSDLEVPEGRLEDGAHLGLDGGEKLGGQGEGVGRRGRSGAEGGLVVGDVLARARAVVGVEARDDS